MTRQNSRNREKKTGDADRSAERQRAIEKLEALALEGLRSGHLIEATPEYWAKKHREFMHKHMTDPMVRARYEKLIAEEDAQWAARAEAAEAEGGYLGPEKSMKALLNLLKRSPEARKRKQKA